MGMTRGYPQHGTICFVLSGTIGLPYSELTNMSRKAVRCLSASPDDGVEWVAWRHTSAQKGPL